MFAYTRCMIEKIIFRLDVLTEDLYHSGMADEILSIKTYYDNSGWTVDWTSSISSSICRRKGELHEPRGEIELDEYRSYNRSKRSGLQTSKKKKVMTLYPN